MAAYEMIFIDIALAFTDYMNFSQCISCTLKSRNKL